MKKGYVSDESIVKREIWVKREDSQIEFKVWYIYTFKFVGDSERKISDFIKNENHRYAKNDKCDFRQVAQEYSKLDTSNTCLPPRLLSISEEDLKLLNTDLVIYKNEFILGDSVGGISPQKSTTHNEHLSKEVILGSTILFSPGVLARVIIEDGKSDSYIFQLSEKNLRKKGEIFYKPIGGHLKLYNDSYKALIEKYKLIPKTRSEIQDLNDVCFYIKAEYFNEFIGLFLDDTFTLKKYSYFENPLISILREMFEELGPLSSSDGINLLEREDFINIYDNKNS